MQPIVECWANVVRERGILLESHSQNLLLEIDHHFQPTRIVHRDCDVWIDGDVRHHLGLDTPFLGACVSHSPLFSREQYYSLVYDHFIGRELFDYLLKTLSRSFAIDEKEVRGNVAAAFPILKISCLATQPIIFRKKFFPAMNSIWSTCNSLPNGDDFVTTPNVTAKTMCEFLRLVVADRGRNSREFNPDLSPLFNQFLLRRWSAA